MRLPSPPVQILLFSALLIFLFILVQLGLLKIAADKLGISFGAALVGLFLCIPGSVINLPIARLPGRQTDPTRNPSGPTLVAINLGGALLPILFSLYLFGHIPLAVSSVALASACVAAISYLVSRPVPGRGVLMPVFIPPLTAAICGLIIAPQHSAALAYVSGTFGVLFGADILRLRHLRDMDVRVVLIGGAGTFDGIFLTGIVAVLLS